MKEFLKKTLAQVPLGNTLIRNYRYLRQRRNYSRFKNTQELFTAYFHENKWADDESRSGPGSTAEYTENIRREIPLLLERLGVKRMLDAPCGDYNWFRLIPRPAVSYVGGDIVVPLIQANQARYGNANTHFQPIDITKDSLPAVDLWMCRDCLFHLSEKSIFAALENFLRSDIRWLLTSTHPKCDVNTDIPDGSFRLMNLALPPYNFPPPAVSIVDWLAPHPYRHLALWDRSAVAQALSKRRGRN